MNTISATVKEKKFRLFSPIKIEYNSKQFIPAFDGWRGVGIIMVLIAHCFDSPVTRSFWVSMDLFFVMSGFLITGILLDSKQSKHYYKNYIVRRVLRVFPLYYFVLFISFLIIPYTFPNIMGGYYDYYVKNQLWFWLYVQNWLYSIDGLPKNHSMVHFWSLAVEEQFYVFWPFFIKMFSNKNLLKFCVVLIAVSIYFRLVLGWQLGLSETYPYMATLSRMDSLSIGAAIAVLIRDNKPWLERNTNIIAWLSGICALAGFVYFRSGSFLHLHSIFTFVDLFSGCILLYSLSANKSFLIRLGDNKIFGFLGKYCYGIYIYHYIFYNILYSHFQPLVFDYSHRQWIAVGVTGVLTIILSILISIVSFKYLELPFLKLKKYFSYK